MLSNRDIQQLRSLTNFPALVTFLRDRLDWPLDIDDTANIEEVEDLTYRYETDELGIAPQYAVKIKRIYQLRNLVDEQPWGIFYVEFDSRRLPVGALRRILNAFVTSRRSREADHPVWNLSDLLFICVQGPANRRGVAFAHFRKAEGQSAPELRTFSWDSQENHFYYLSRLNIAKLQWPVDESSPERWRDQWRTAFTSRHREIIRDSEKLASAMAEHAAIIRELISDRYAVETENDPLHSLFKRFRELLLHDLTPDTFADMVAQTITYGLFSAAEQTPTLTYESLVELIPKTNPFLKQLLSALIEEAGLDLSELGVGPLLNLLRDVPVTQIARDFGRQTGSGQEDPVVHFYEQFLQEYDRQQRVERGVFYTPDPVVSYIVRAVDDLLKSEFGIQDGLASAERDPTTGEHRVQILDPATGTGTFLAHIIDQIATAKQASNTPQWNEYVAQDLLPRLNGFELMMAPYTIAHMKLGLKLRETGYNFESDERLRVFLTNALEEPLEKTQTLKLAGFLSRESNEAAQVKRTRPVMVVLGNPPYSVSSSNKSPWIEDLMDSYKKAVRSERNIQPLSDDYIKFMRLAQDRIEQTGQGIVGIITNHAYLAGLIHRGMREELMQTFTKIYVLDLHGNATIGETSPDGSADENIFDIRQGVAIALFVKKKKQNTLAQVNFFELWGKRERKYEYLRDNDIGTTNWQALVPQNTYFFFVPKNFDLVDEYKGYNAIGDDFPINSSGIKTHRDHFVVDFDQMVLKKRIERFRDKLVSDKQLKELYSLKENASWSITKARQAIRSNDKWSEDFTQCFYRPFDIKPIYFSEHVIDRLRPEVMAHCLQPNLVLATCRQQVETGFKHIFVTKYVGDGNAVSLKSREYGYYFPLYLYPKEQKNAMFDTTDSPWKLSHKGRRPNLSKAFVEELVGKLNLSFITDGRGDLLDSFGPEDIFHYAYAVFHSPTYRQRYAEFLKIDFPRLPITNNLTLFRNLAQLGADLVALHLLEDDYVAASWTLEGEDSPLAQTGVEFVMGKNGSTVGAMAKSKAWQEGRVYIDTSTIKKDGSHFTGVPESVWNFFIGGYQVCHKWLYDRRGSKKKPGRTLTPDDINHYKRIVAALRETKILMEAIDRTIDQHGGWPLTPLTGSQPEVEPEAVESEIIEEQEEEIEMSVEPEKDIFDEKERQNPDLTTDTVDIIIDHSLGIEYETQDSDEQREVQPFDPTLIRVDTRPLTVDLLIRRIKNKEIILKPDFQRMGGIWNDKAQSRLIESLMIRIPLPAFYMDASDDEKWLVIDGLQRLTALKRFIIDKDDKRLKLQNLEFWHDYNGLTFDELPRPLQRRIEETQVTLYLVQRGTPHNVKFNIFKRINTGGVPLSRQEIRHALNLGESTDLLIELAKSKEFLQATDNSVSPKRMTDRECVLRFLAFTIKNYSDYGKRDELDPFLNDRMQEMNHMPAESLDTLRQRFKRAMLAAHKIWGKQAFRKQYHNRTRRSPISKALFEVWSVNLDRLSDTQIKKLIQPIYKRRLNEKFIDLMENTEFFNAITTSTGDPSRVKARFSGVERIIQEVLNA